MDALFHGGTDTILLAVIAALSWFAKREMNAVWMELKRIKSGEEILALVDGKFVSRKEFELELENLELRLKHSKEGD